MTRPLTEREKWFVGRIGKRVFRNYDGCDCEMCFNILKNGLIIDDAQHANYLYEMELSYAADGDKLRYFDTPEEVREWLKTQPK